MSKEILTREFSICLLPADDFTSDVEVLRSKLPESPYRDDMAHITLIRGVSSRADLSDEALASEIDFLLSLSDHLPLIGTVQRIANMSNQFYTDTGVIILESSKELLDFRKVTADRLMRCGYAVEAQELNTYAPHITVRLGVPLEGKLLGQASAKFGNRRITFGRWLLFRLILQDDKRLMHVVWPR